MSTPQREFDIVLFGVTGFTGRLVAEYLGAQGQPLRWAWVARNREKLDEVFAALSPALGVTLPTLLIADASDREALTAIARRTRVICTTVGPYARYGNELVGACAEAGTHYCDLTGEAPWIRRMIDAHHQTASKSGARIVHTCGFDSIPSDIGTLFVQDAMRERYGVNASHVTSLFGETKGGPSGGTIATVFNMFDELRRDRELRRIAADPYSLDPGHQGPDGRDRMTLGYDKRVGLLTMPFVMAAINTRVVRRSNALLGYRYGRDFRYDEVMSAPKSLHGVAIAAGVTGMLAGMVLAATNKRARDLIRSRLPKPGEGPSEAVRNAGYWKVRIVAESSDGHSLLATLGDAHADPGYGSTAKMLGQSALCLAFDDLHSPGGITTPAAAMGAPLIARLRNAGLQFDVEDLPS